MGRKCLNIFLFHIVLCGCVKLLQMTFYHINPHFIQVESIQIPS